MTNTFFEDGQGNKLYLKDNKMFLQLGGNILSIGEIKVDKESGRNVYYKKVSDRHIFRKNDSWGINLSSLNFLENDDLIRLYYSNEKKTYELTKSQLLEKGEFLWFKATGFEKQIFVPRNEWTLVQQKEASTKLW